MSETVDRLTKAAEQALAGATRRCLCHTCRHFMASYISTRERELWNGYCTVLLPEQGKLGGDTCCRWEGMEPCA